MNANQVITLSFFILAIFPTISAQCSPGTYSVSNGTCVQCDISCQTCSSADGCSTCYDQMYLAPVGNQVLCQLCYVLNSQCAICITATKCSQCSNGFYLQNDQTCSPCSKAVPNCQFCYQNGTSFQCLTCTYPSNLINGFCVSDQINATSPTLGGVVVIQLNQSITPSPIINTQVQNSTTQTQNSPQQTNSATATTPINCTINQILVNGTCLNNILYCTQYDPITLNCNRCLDGYGLSQQFYCIPTNLLLNTQTSNPSQTQITSTPPITTALTTTSTTNPSSPTTTITTPTQSTTTTITSTSTSASASTVTASSPPTSSSSQSQGTNCGLNQYLWYGQCVTIGTECINRDQLGQCQSCIVGYQQTNGLCVQLPPPTNPVASPQPTPTSNNCTSPCLTCSNAPTYCLTCINNYTTVDAFPGKCFPLMIAN